MRRLTMFAGLLSAAGALLIGMAYRFAATMDPDGHAPAKASEIRSKSTSGGSFPALATVGVPEESTGQRPLSGPHDVGEPVALLSDGRPIEGDVVMARLESGRCWRHGQSMCHRTGSSGSIATTRCKQNWNHFVRACNEADRSTRRSGKRKLRNDWAWNRPIRRPVAGEELASIRMPPPNVRSLG
jgi:hypothetical protein